VSSYQFGSSARDRFKGLHDDLGPDEFHALDVDFEFVDKRGKTRCSPEPAIIARVDFKRPDDRVKYSEVVAYNWMIARGVPVYIIECSNPGFADIRSDEHRFEIRRYYGGDFNDPPHTVQKTVARHLTWRQLFEWERCFRGGGPGTFQERYGLRVLGIDNPSDITAYTDGGENQ
jgi:hypothetical protein